MATWITRLATRVLRRLGIEIRRTSWPPDPDDSGFAPASSWGDSDLETLYEATAWSYACIVSNAIEASSLGAQVQRKESGRWIRDEGHELNAFLQAPSGPSASPTKPPQWSWNQLVFLWFAHEYLEGNAYLVPTIVDGGRKLYKVAPLLPDRVTIKEDSQTGYATGYQVNGKIYKPDELVHLTFPNPLSFSEGHAPIQAALRAIKIDYTASERVNWNLENKVAPGVVVETTGFLQMQKAQRDEILAYLRSAYAGASKDGTPLVFGDGTKVLSAPDAKVPQNENVRVDARNEILAVMRTPPPVVGIMDSATLDNYATAYKLWWTLGLFPMLNQNYGQLNTQLIHPIYGPDTRLWYDDIGSEIALLLFLERARAARELVDMGYPPNLATKMVGLDLEHVEELDVPLQNLALAGRAGDTQTEEG